MATTSTPAAGETSLESATPALSPGLPPTHANAVNTNDVRRFVYAWFTLFEHRAPAQRLVDHLTADERFRVAMPGSEPIHDTERFVAWYEELLVNTRWNFHELSALVVEPLADGAYRVAFDVDWQGAVTEGSAWPTNLPERTYRFALHQQWRVLVRAGEPLDNPFSIVDLVAETR